MQNKVKQKKKKKKKKKRPQIAKGHNSYKISLNWLKV